MLYYDINRAAGGVWSRRQRVRSNLASDRGHVGLNQFYKNKIFEKMNWPGRGMIGEDTSHYTNGAWTDLK